MNRVRKQSRNNGMAFENTLELTNQMYMRKNIAVINKRGTPVKILRKVGNQITSGYVEKSSTVDYDGVYKGRSIHFDAKSILELDRFDLKMVHEHQYEHLLNCQRHGAICFLLVEFIAQRKIYLLTIDTLRSYVEAAKNGGRKSIRIEDFDIHAYEVDKYLVGRVPVDYLKTVDQAFCITTNNELE